MKRRTLILRIFLAFLFSFPSCLYCGGKKENLATGVEVGGIAPDFSLQDINGKSYSLKEIRGKKPVLLVFWATWCQYCVQEIPELNKIHQEYSKKGFEVWAIDIKESKEKVSRFASKKGIKYTILLDSAGKVANLYQIRGIPANIVLGKNGVVKHNGGLPEDYKTLFTQLTECSGNKK